MLGGGDKSTQAKDVARAAKMASELKTAESSEEGEEIEMSTKINPKVACRLGVRRFDASEYLRDEADIAA